MAAFGEERPLPQSPKQLQHLEGFERCKSEIWAVLPSPLGIPRPPVPATAKSRSIPEQRNATSGAGRTHDRGEEKLPRGEGRGAEHPPRSLLAFGRDARLRRERREVRKLPISGPESPGNATGSQESYLPRENYVLRGNASQQATGLVPAAAHRCRSGHHLPSASLLLRAPQGHSRFLGRA